VGGLCPRSSPALWRRGVARAGRWLLYHVPAVLRFCTTVRGTMFASTVVQYIRVWDSRLRLHACMQAAARRSDACMHAQLCHGLENSIMNHYPMHAGSSQAVRSTRILLNRHFAEPPGTRQPAQRQARASPPPPPARSCPAPTASGPGACAPGAARPTPPTRTALR
jgi:hypothetical protein